jgi:hypothetical protein
MIVLSLYLASITVTSDMNVAFKDIDWALLVGCCTKKSWNGKRRSS